MFAAVDRFFQRGGVKLGLAFLIVVSVLPFDEVRRFDMAFFFIFAVELALRALLFFRSRGRRSAGEMVLLVVDLVAVLSFLPAVHGLFESRYLRFLRLARLTLLFRYVSSLARGLWNIVSRHEIKYQLGFLVGGVLLLTTVAGTVLHALDVPVDLNNDGRTERASLRDLLWWAFRNIEDSGNLAHSLDAPLTYVLFSVSLTIVGVLVMSLIIGIGSSVVQQLLAADRERPVKVSGHLMVVGRGPNLPYLLREITEIIRKRRRRLPVVLLSDARPMPSYLYEPELKNVEYRAGDLSDHRALELVNPAEASRVLVLYDQDKREHADAATISTVLALRERTNARVLLELRHRRNMGAALAAGGRSITPVPLAKILGNILCQNLVFPGIDRVYEELLTAAGNDVNVYEFPPRERARLARAQGVFPFATLLSEMYRRFAVLPIGVLVEKDGTVVAVLDPLNASDPDWAPEAGKIRPAALAGLVAICRRERDLEKAAKWMSKGCRGIVEGPSPSLPDVALSLDETFTKLRRVLVVGENEMLPTLVEETGRFVQGVAFDVLVQGRERGRTLARQLQERWKCELDSGGNGSGALTCRERLTKGGNVTIQGAEGDLMHMLSRDGPMGDARFDAAVFLADNRAPDPDAQNLLWLFSLLDAVQEGRVASSERFHIIAEILSSAKGEIMERRAATAQGRRVRALSTQKLRSYFMAHCLFVPQLHRIYDELVSAGGLEFCHVIPKGVSGNVPFSGLLDALAAKGVILFGVEYRDGGAQGEFVANPDPRGPDAIIEMDRVKRLFVIGDTEKLRGDA